MGVKTMFHFFLYFMRNSRVEKILKMDNYSLFSLVLHNFAFKYSQLDHMKHPNR